MEKLEPLLPQTSYSQELANLYKKLKKTDGLLTSQKITVYINKHGNLAIFESKKEAKTKEYTKLENKELHKQIKLELSKGTIDHKIARTAVKALLFLPWEKPLEVKPILADFSTIINSAISPKRSHEIDSMLSQIKTLKRSEEGGNGVIFFDCKTSELFSGATSFVIKFVNDARSILCADRLLQAMGFVTPKSCFVHDASPLKKKLISATLENLAFIHTDNHTQVKKQTNEMRCVLIMSTLNEAVSLRHLPGNELREFLSADNILNQLGKMIFIDILMNNTDRWNTHACNLGNMLLNNNGILHLVDHEMKISVELISTIKSNLKALLEGKMTDEIISVMEQALKFDRKKMGSVTLLAELKQKMKTGLDKGIHQAAIQLCKLLESPTAYNFIFQPHLEESEKIDSKSFLELVKFVHKLSK